MHHNIYKEHLTISYHSTHPATEQELNDSHGSASDFRSDGSKAYSRRQTSKVQKQDRRQYLSLLLESICPVRLVVLAPPTQIGPERDSRVNTSFDESTLARELSHETYHISSDTSLFSGFGAVCTMFCILSTTSVMFLFLPQ